MARTHQRGYCHAFQYVIFTRSRARIPGGVGCLTGISKVRAPSSSLTTFAYEGLLPRLLANVYSMSHCSSRVRGGRASRMTMSRKRYPPS